MARIRAELRTGGGISRTTFAFAMTGSVLTSNSGWGVPTRVDSPEHGVPTAVLSRDAAAVVPPEVGGIDADGGARTASRSVRAAREGGADGGVDRAGMRMVPGEGDDEGAAGGCCSADDVYPEGTRGLRTTLRFLPIVDLLGHTGLERGFFAL